LALFFPYSTALAQTGDWQAVENLPRRSLISVEDMHHTIHGTCRFQGVVDTQLLCEYGSHAFDSSEVAFRRESIRAVRREHNSTLIGMAIGAGSGAVIGAARDSTPGGGRGGSALVGAGIFGGLGAIAGSDNGHFHFSHGTVIYHNPDDKNRTEGTAQAQDRESEGGIAAADRIGVARSQYAQTNDLTPGASDHITLAQSSRRGPGVPFPRRGGYPRAGYGGMWMSEGSGRHALIGALIGFGMGAAIVAKGNGGVRASLAFGTLGAGIGAAMGFTIPPLPSRNPYQHGWPDPDEDEWGSRAKPVPTKPEATRQTAALQPAPSQSAADMEDPHPLPGDAP